MSVEDVLCEFLAMAAWQIGNPDITATAQQIASHDWQSCRDSIIDGLTSLTNDEYLTDQNMPQESIMGECRIGANLCYWWSNNAESRWSCDKPEWWEEAVERLEATYEDD